MLLSKELFELIKEIGNGTRSFSANPQDDPETQERFDRKVIKIIYLKDENYIECRNENILRDSENGRLVYSDVFVDGLTYNGDQIAQYDSYEAYVQANQPRGPSMSPFTVNDNRTIFHGDINQSAVTLHSPNATVSIQFQKEAINDLLQQAEVALQADQTIEPSQREDYLTELEIVKKQLSKNNPPLERIKEGLSPMADLASVGALVLQIMGMLGF